MYSPLGTTPPLSETHEAHGTGHHSKHSLASSGQTTLDFWADDISVINGEFDSGGKFNLWEQMKLLKPRSDFVSKCPFMVLMNKEEEIRKEAIIRLFSLNRRLLGLPGNCLQCL